MPTRYRITLGDEEIEFEGPDDLTDEQIEDLGANFLKTAKPGEAIQRPVYAGEAEGYWEGVGRRAEELGQSLTGFAQGAAETFDNAANLLEGGYNVTLGNLFGESTSADTPAFQNLAAQIGPGDPSTRTAGNVAGSMLLTKGMGGPAAQGAASAAIESDADSGFDFVRDVLIGGVGGKITDGLLKAGGNIISPAVDAGAQLLHKAGVRLTPGQAIPALREWEDKAQSWPFVGSLIKQGRQRSFEDFNRAPLDEALTSATGKGLPAGVKTGHDAIRFTGDRLSTEYDRLIPQLSLKADQQLIADIQSIGQKVAGADFTPATRKRFEAFVRDGVMSRFKGQTATGEEYRAADKFLSERIRRFGSSGNPDHQAMAEALRDVQEALSHGLARSNPGQAAKLDSLNKGWALLVPAEEAAANAARGIYSPAQYRLRVKMNDSRVRRRGMARGEALGQDLAEAAVEVLPSEYPNTSGTASHDAYNLGNLRFWQGAAARPVYNALADPVSSIALAPRPFFAEPVAQGIKALPAGQLGGVGALNALSPYLAVNPNQ